MSRMRLKKALLDALSSMADFPVPPSIADQEFEQIWQQFEEARKAGTQDEEDKAKDEDTLKAEYRAIAERRVRLGLLLAEIGRVNTITVTEQELDRALYQRAMQYPGAGDADAGVACGNTRSSPTASAARCWRTRSSISCWNWPRSPIRS